MKKIGSFRYCHRSNIEELSENITVGQQIKIMEALALMCEKYYEEVFKKYQVIKFDKKNDSVTFILSEDWDSAREPMVGDAYRVEKDKKITLIKNKGQIYHHKWQFVAKDYTGFDVEESKKWSKKWTSIIPQTKEIKSRIGYKKYWLELLKKYDL